MKIYLLSTCDSWKSRDSLSMFYIDKSTKVGTKRLVNAIIKGIKDGVFVYGSNESSKEEQVAMIEEDFKKGGMTFFYDIQNKLDYGFLQVVECGVYM